MWSKFSRIHMTHLFYLSYFLVGSPILHVEMLWGNFNGNFQQGLEFSGELLRGGGGDFLRKKFFEGEVSPGEILHRKIFCGGNFSLVGRVFQKIFYTQSP